MGTEMETKNLTIWDIIEKHKDSSQLESRFVGTAPTHEWSGEANLDILGDLAEINYRFSFFRSNVKGQPLFGKLCVCFVTFGNPPE